jgi:hypothetical protein
LQNKANLFQKLKKENTFEKKVAGRGGLIRPRRRSQPSPPSQATDKRAPHVSSIPAPWSPSRGRMSPPMRDPRARLNASPLAKQAPFIKAPLPPLFSLQTPIANRERYRSNRTHEACSTCELWLPLCTLPPPNTHRHRHRRARRHPPNLIIITRSPRSRCIAVSVQKPTRRS